MGRCCAECGYNCDPDDYSSNQWRKGPGNSRCTDCVSGKRVCCACRCALDPDSFSNNQWSKGNGHSRCVECVTGDRICAECGSQRDPDEYSSNQWSKGPGSSRCRDCLNKPQCPECGRTFTDMNALKMHMQVHRPRSLACPVCGDVRFKSGANAVQHVESGYCRGCMGQENARKQIYMFASSQSAMKPFMSNRLMLTSGSGATDVPDYPYNCPTCSMPFHQLSQLLQHQDQKHNNARVISYG